jgi:hypothetical protein
MQQGTPEQIKLIRHRLRLLIVVWCVYVGIAFGLPLIRYRLQLTVPPLVVQVYVFGYLVCGGIALAFLSAVYWRCPVCNKAFTRRSGGEYCDRCNTKYGA